MRVSTSRSLERELPQKNAIIFLLWLSFVASGILLWNWISSRF
jgi:hypothetical protein